jgi:hypothetical protein
MYIGALPGAMSGGIPRGRTVEFAAPASVLIVAIPRS